MQAGIPLRKYTLFILLLLLLPTLTPAQIELSYYLPAGTSYDPAIPTPASHLGYQVGEWHVRHDLLAGYMQALAAASDRIAITEYGRTYEQRPLLLLTITSPENQRNIETLRQQHLALTDPARSSDLAVENMPVVVWMGYSVHGNESSGANAALVVAYHLAAAQGAAIDSLLRHSIILLDPCINPDGLSRFAQWANMHKAKNLVADPYNREHTEVWPGGRTNHYWFDLNRDWLPLQHPESQGRLRQFHAWKPNVLTDHHEMGTNSTFFFQPGIPSRNHPLTPQRTFDLTAAIAEYHARALDRLGSLYYARESFDDFYFGKGSTFPDINGSIGILFEQASSRGHLQKSIHGDLSFPFTIRNQVTVSFSTLEASLALRLDLLRHLRDFYSSAAQEASRAPIKAYVFGAKDDAARTHHFVEMLRRHDIRVHRLAREVRSGDQRFEPGTAFIASTQQPQFRLLTAMFERRTSFTDSLFYDVSAWTLPLAFGLPYAELSSQQFAPTLLGDAIDRPNFPAGRVIGAGDAYAYAFEWQGYYAPRALHRLLKAGIKAKVATEPFRMATAEGEKDFGYGAIMVPVGIQQQKADSIRAIVNTIAREDGIAVYAFTTGYARSGSDLGSNNFEMLQQPKILLVAGQGTSVYEVGEIWHLLDQRYHIPVSLVEQRFLDNIELHNYTTIVLASGSYNDISEGGKAALKRWLQQGGTIVALDGALRWLQRAGLADLAFKSSKPDTSGDPRPYAALQRDRGARVTGGAIFRGTIDTSHPVGYGIPGPLLSLFKRGNTMLKPAKSPYATPVRFTADPLQAGYIAAENLDLLKSSGAVVVTGMGSGKVICLTINPNFRAFWYGTNKLFINSVLFGSIISNQSTRPAEQ